jgi:hypothetical protein
MDEMASEKKEKVTPTRRVSTVYLASKKILFLNRKNIYTYFLHSLILKFI